MVGARKKMEPREGHPSKINLRATGRRTKGNLLEYIRSIAPNEELAARLEKVLEKRSLIRLRTSTRYPAWPTSTAPSRRTSSARARRPKRSAHNIPPRNPEIVKLKGFLKGLRVRRKDVKAAKKSLFGNARG